MSTKVYGASDDLVEVEGDVRGEIDKYNTSEEKPVRLAFSDGTILAWWYNDDGLWKVKVEAKGTLLDRVEVCLEETGAGHSDVVHFRDGLTQATYRGKPVR